MTYSRDKIAGLSLADAIGVICAPVTDTSRWASFRGCIKLSERQSVSIGNDEGQVTRGILIIGGPEPQKTQDEIDAEAYAAALRPMVDDLATGKLVTECRAIASGGGLPSFLFEADRWEDGWKLIVDGKSVFLIDEAGTKYKVLSFQVANVQPPRAAAGTMPPASIVHAVKRVRGQSKEDEVYFPMIQKIIEENAIATPWTATSQLVEKGTIPIGNSQPKSVIERVSGKYEKAGRPKTHAEALGKALTTQK